MGRWERCILRVNWSEARERQTPNLPPSRLVRSDPKAFTLLDHPDVARDAWLLLKEHLLSSATEGGAANAMKLAFY